MEAGRRDLREQIVYAGVWGRPNEHARSAAFVEQTDRFVRTNALLAEAPVVPGSLTDPTTPNDHLPDFLPELRRLDGSYTTRRLYPITSNMPSFSSIRPYLTSNSSVFLNAETSICVRLASISAS